MRMVTSQRDVRKLSSRCVLVEHHQDSQDFGVVLIVPQPISPFDINLGILMMLQWQSMTYIPPPAAASLLLHFQLGAQEVMNPLINYIHVDVAASSSFFGLIEQLLHS